MQANIIQETKTVNYVDTGEDYPSQEEADEAPENPGFFGSKLMRDIQRRERMDRLDDINGRGEDDGEDGRYLNKLTTEERKRDDLLTDQLAGQGEDDFQSAKKGEEPKDYIVYSPFQEKLASRLKQANEEGGMFGNFGNGEDEIPEKSQEGDDKKSQ